MKPNKKQQEAIDYVVSMGTGRVAYIDGEAGSGKSFTIDQIASQINNLLKCAFTGNAAQNINGVTFHSLFKIPAGYIWNPEQTFGDYRRYMFGKYGVSTSYRFHKRVKDVFVGAPMIVVDEAPNASCYMIDHADWTLRWALDKPEVPFGGMPMVFSGDRGQLQPVINHQDESLLKSYGYKPPYDFLEAKVWQRCGMKRLHLTDLMRQTNRIEGNLLSRLRTGSQLDSDLEMLNRNVTSVPPMGARVITVLNRQARSINEAMLKRETGKEFAFEEDRTGIFLKQKKDAHGAFAKVLKLKIGCKVVIKVNGKCKSNGEEVSYVNGDTGTFEGIDKHDRLMVQLSCGTMLYINKHKYEDA